MHHPPLLGAHLSVAGGLYKAIEQAEQLGCTALQIFTHSSRQWSFDVLSGEATQAFIQARKKSSLKTILVHASYLINPASPEASARNRAVVLLKKELEACLALEIPFLVLHPGSRLHSDITSGLRACADTINEALRATQKTIILIENMAGQGSSIGSRLEELQQLYNMIDDKKRVGFCIDTCHAFAAGYDFSTPEKYRKFWDTVDATIGISTIHALHLNDSIKPLNSHVDRHTHIGQGALGLEPFKLIMNDPRLSHCAKILETPKGVGLDDDRKNLEVLRSLIKE